MNVELSPDQKRALEAQHRKCRDRRVCDRIRCVLLSAEGWSSSMIAKSQLIDETTVRRHLHDWLNDEKLNPVTWKENEGHYRVIVEPEKTFILAYGKKNLFVLV